MKKSVKSRYRFENYNVFQQLYFNSYIQQLYVFQPFVFTRIQLFKFYIHHGIASGDTVELKPILE